MHLRKVKLVLLITIFFWLFCSNIYSDSPYLQIWTQTSNPSSNIDAARGVAVNPTGIYVVGQDDSYGDSNCQWRIEERSLSGGNTVWIQTNNPSNGFDYPQDVGVDSTGIYVVGYDYSLGNNQWRIEKRSLTTGSTTWIQTSNPSSNSDVAYDVAVDSTGIYVVGYDNSPGNSQWRIEKRSLLDGSTIWVQTNNPTIYTEVANSVAVDSTGIYVVGDDNSPGDSQWRIEKRSLTDGSTIWVQTNNPSSSSEEACGVAVDLTGIYVIGTDNSLGNTQWRIEKRSLLDGSTIWVQTSNPSSNSDVAYDVAVDSTGIYVVGYDWSPGNFQWRIEKRNLTDGNTIWIQTSNPSSGDDRAYDVAVDSTGIYVVGYDYSLGNYQWRIEKYVPLPPAPTNVFGIANSTAQISWNWTDNSSGVYQEDGFRIFSATSSTLFHETLPGVTSWVQTNLIPNTSYSIYIQAFNVNGSSNSTITTTYTLASSPTGLTKVTVYVTSATIQWNNIGATRYAIERSTGIVSPSSWTYIVTWSSNVIGTDYTDKELSPETTYWYRIRGYNGDQIITEPSNEISILTLPPPPTSFYGTVKSTSSIMWLWTDNSKYESGFYIYSSTGGIIDTLEKDTTCRIETNLTPNTQYTRYTVTYNSSGESSPSNSDSKYTLANPPTGLNAVNVYVTSSTIFWDDVGATKYAIERSTGVVSPSSWTYIVTWSSDVIGTNYTDTGLLRGTTYWYRIKSYNSDEVTNDEPSDSLKIITIMNNSPILSWTNETNYTSDGLNPETGTSTMTYTYRVNYMDPDNDAPKTDYPKVHILKNGNEITNSPFTMSQVYSTDTVYNDGKLYTFPTLLSQSTSYTYYFEVYDTYDTSATQFISGTGPNVINNIPILTWTNEENYLSDGLNPESGNPEMSVLPTTFTFRVKYIDYDNDSPKTDYPKLHIKKNNSEIPGSPFTMFYASGTYNTGAIYSYPITFSTGGADYTYYFETLDEYDDFAIGVATATLSGPVVNQRPATPSTPSGLTSSLVGENYYCSVSATDPNGDQVKYGWDWNGDGLVDEWSGLNDSGWTDTRLHIFSTPGTYNIKVKARDSNGTDSFWSNALTVTVTKTVPVCIKGYVKNVTGVGIAGIVADLYGDLTKSTVTSSSGYYEFLNLDTGGSYIVKPTSADYCFSPEKRSYTGLSGNHYDQDFTGISKIIEENGFTTENEIAENVDVTVKIIITVTDEISDIKGATIEIPSFTLSTNTIILIGKVINPPPMLKGVVSKGKTIDFRSITINIVFNTYVTIKLPYPADVTNPYALRVYTYDNNSSAWKELPVKNVDTTNRLITAETNHLSYYTLVSKVEDNLNKVTVYPNPYNPSGGYDHINFSHLTSQATIRIFNIAGELVRTIEETDNDGLALWYADNESGTPVASGVYIYIVTNPQGEKKTGKVAIIK